MNKRESLRIWLLRTRFNFFPAFRGTGARIVYISEDFRTIRVKLPLNRRTRNIHGTLFGGAMYAATDPLYALLIKIGLGKDYIVWDKAGTIQYRKPGRTTLYAECVISENELEELRSSLEADCSVNRDFEIELVDEAGVTHASVRKTIYVADKQWYLSRQAENARKLAAE